MENSSNPRSELRKVRLQVLFNFEGPEPSKEKNGGIAQLGERLLCKQEVNGSIPFISTTGRNT